MFPQTVTVNLQAVKDVFTSCQQGFTLSKIPYAGITVFVFLNGALMCEGMDYALDGQALTFTAQQVVGDGPVVQVFYAAAVEWLPRI